MTIDQFHDPPINEVMLWALSEFVKTLKTNNIFGWYFSVCIVYFLTSMPSI